MRVILTVRTNDSSNLLLSSKEFRNPKEAISKAKEVTSLIIDVVVFVSKGNKIIYSNES